MIQSMLTNTLFTDTPSTFKTTIFSLRASFDIPVVHLWVSSQCLKPTYAAYAGDGHGLRGHWVYLIIDCQIKGCSSLESSLTPTSICLHLEKAWPAPLPSLHSTIHPSTASSLVPLPLSSTPNYPSIYLSIYWPWPFIPQSLSLLRSIPSTPLLLTC